MYYSVFITPCRPCLNFEIVIYSIQQHAQHICSRRSFKFSSVNRFNIPVLHLCGSERNEKFQVINRCIFYTYSNTTTIILLWHWCRYWFQRWFTLTKTADIEHSTEQLTHINFKKRHIAFCTTSISIICDCWRCVCVRRFFCFC